MYSWLCGTFFALFIVMTGYISGQVRQRMCKGGGSARSAVIHFSGKGGISMTRTFYSLICGALILLAAVTPIAILIVDKAGF